MLKNRALLPATSLLFFLPLSLHGYVEHQGYLYGGTGVSKAWVDSYGQGYITAPAVFGAGYRLNWHGGGIHVLEFGLSLGGGYAASYGGSGLPAGNSLVEMDISLSYGLAFGRYKEHQLTVIGGTLSPRFHGMVEKDRYRAIGGTEVRYYEGSYAMLLMGVVLPGYRYVHRNFMVGFRQQFLVLAAGHLNVNYPQEYRVLGGFGYEFKLELGFSFVPKGPKREQGMAAPRQEMELRYRSGGRRGILSVSVGQPADSSPSVNEGLSASAKGEGVVMDLDIYLGKKPLAFARDIPIFEGRAQFTKYLNPGELRVGERVMIYYTLKDGEGGILSTHSKEVEVIE